MQPQQAPQTSKLDNRPRILCLHGGGVNSKIFETQSRVLIRQLPDFRLCFADAPFLSSAGPGILPIYQEWGPYRSWLRLSSIHAEGQDEAIIRQVRSCVERCKTNDAGTGPWVGILGFSQGGKVAASILYDQQIRREKDGSAIEEDFKFGVIMAARAPLVSMCEYSLSPALATPTTAASSGGFTLPSPHILRIPTIHVHGLQDEGLSMHRQLAAEYCSEASRTIIEWEGDHTIPIKMGDTTRIAQSIYKVARQQGVLAT